MKKLKEQRVGGEVSDMWGCPDSRWKIQMYVFSFSHVIVIISNHNGCCCCWLVVLHENIQWDVILSHICFIR